MFVGITPDYEIDLDDSSSAARRSGSRILMLSQSTLSTSPVVRRGRVRSSHCSDWARRGAALEGVALAPEAGACLGVLELLVAEEAIDPDERVVIFNTGAAQKYVEVIGSDPLPLLPNPVDWGKMNGTSMNETGE